jgi:coenzyme PQQ precursor peptide PqqA
MSVIETTAAPRRRTIKEIIMKIWTAPAVREQNVGLEVTSYLPADIDLV